MAVYMFIKIFLCVTMSLTELPEASDILNDREGL